MVCQPGCPPAHGKNSRAPWQGPLAHGRAPLPLAGIPLPLLGLPLPLAELPLPLVGLPLPLVGPLAPGGAFDWHCSLLYLTYTQVQPQSAISWKDSENAAK